MSNQGTGISVEAMFKEIRDDIRAHSARVERLTRQQNGLTLIVTRLSGLNSEFKKHEELDDKRHNEVMAWQRKVMIYVLAAIVFGMGFGMGFGILKLSPEYVLKILATR